MSLDLTYDPQLSRVQVAVRETVLNTNPFFEVDASGWFVNSGEGSIAWSTAQAHEGVASLLLTPDGVGSQAAARSVAASGISPGQSLTGRAWLRCAVARTVRLRIDWRDSGGTFLSSSNLDIAVAANTWTFFEVIATAPASTAQAGLTALMTGTPAGSNLLYIDEAKLVSPTDLVDAASYRLERSTDQIRWSTVRGGTALVPVSGAVSLDDYEFVADVENFYRLVGPSVADDFTRTVADGWGSATTGQVWSTVGGSASDYSVSGGVGQASAGVVGSSRFTLLPDDVTNVDLAWTMSVPAVATGNWIGTGPVIRYQDTSNYYWIETHWDLSGVLELQLTARVGGSSTAIAGPVTVGTYTADQRWRLRVSFAGSLLQAKLWLAASPEPDTWTLSVTTTAITAAGQIGQRTLLNTGNSNTLPVVASYDDLVVSSPTAVAEGATTTSTFLTDTFTRSVSNGWGTPDVGSAWTVAGGSVADFSVNGSAGLHDAQQEVSTKRSLMDGPKDLDATWDVSIPEVSSGDSAQAAMLVREDGTNSNFYAFRVLFFPSGELELRIAKRVNGSETNIANPPGTQDVYTGGTVVHVRCQAIGPQLRMKCWTDADPEPAGWQASASDATFPLAGRIGFRSALGDDPFAWTGTVPLTFTYDNVSVDEVHAASIIPTLDTVWLKSVERPFLNRPVRIRDQSDFVRPSRSGRFPIVGRSLPIAVTDVRGGKQFTLQVYAADAAEARALDLLLASGDVLFIHTPATGRLSRVPGGHVDVGDSSELVMDTADYDLGYFDLPCAHVAPPGPEVVGVTYTYAGVANDYATYADLIAANATYADLVEHVGDAEDVVVE